MFEAWPSFWLWFNHDVLSPLVCNHPRSVRRSDHVKSSWACNDGAAFYFMKTKQCWDKSLWTGSKSGSEPKCIRLEKSRLSSHKETEKQITDWTTQRFCWARVPTLALRRTHTRINQGFQCLTVRTSILCNKRWPILSKWTHKTASWRMTADGNSALLILLERNKVSCPLPGGEKRLKEPLNGASGALQKSCFTMVISNDS